MKILARAVGRRKEAVAQVQIVEGNGLFIINNKPAHEYLQNNSCSLITVKSPIEVLRNHFVLNKKQDESSSSLLSFPSLDSGSTEATAALAVGTKQTQVEDGRISGATPLKEMNSSEEIGVKISFPGSAKGAKQTLPEVKAALTLDNGFGFVKTDQNNLEINPKSLVASFDSPANPPVSFASEANPTSLGGGKQEKGANLTLEELNKVGISQEDSVVSIGFDSGAQEKHLFDQIDTIVKVKGGGLIGQADAIKLGLARAICNLTNSNDFLNKKVNFSNEKISLLVFPLPPVGKQSSYLTESAPITLAKQTTSLVGSEAERMQTTLEESNPILAEQTAGYDSLAFPEGKQTQPKKLLIASHQNQSELVLAQNFSHPSSLENENEPIEQAEQPLFEEKISLNTITANVRKQLKTKGYLTQDSRIKERRKYGLKKARKAPQYHKR